MQLPMRLSQRPTGKPSREPGIEVRTLGYALMPASEPVADRLPSGLRPSNLLIEFGKFVPGKPPPFFACAVVRSHKRFLLGERESRVAVKQDHGDGPHGRLRIPTLPRNPFRRGQEPEVLVVPQRRRADPRPARQLTDRQGRRRRPCRLRCPCTATRGVDFKCP